MQRSKCLGHIGGQFRPLPRAEMVVDISFARQAVCRVIDQPANFLDKIGTRGRFSLNPWLDFNRLFSLWGKLHEPATIRASRSGQAIPWTALLLELGVQAPCG